MNTTTITDVASAEHDHGFTLIELLIAIVVVGILTAVAIVGIGSLTNSGSGAACKASVDAAQAAGAVHYANNNGLPPADLAALVTAGELQKPNSVSVALNVMNNGTVWSVTYAPATNNFTKTGGGVACA